MNIECIKDANLEETGFNYTMSLIQGKYKMFILYALMGFKVVRFNELKLSLIHIFRWWENHSMPPDSPILGCG